ncbi:hypothetical protein [Acidimangrovimonas sediminis]|uniref:hypothetical protein n=1 Tax=Acidimangrovimonas sediminis TaxID=2056283 RepID=UPI000C7F810B|nr:hypothetical protein [Acidimangrovimonas sediminis]
MTGNPSLPPLPAWHARSFYAALLMIATVICNAMGIDLGGWFATHLGLANESAVLDFVMAVMPIVFGLWAWAERHAPNYRLVWRRIL